ncbi:MAG: hypothetical protein IJY04_07800, partial [Clostridia bacterium]|nr:hypothetical protein [Clostridia bacterium]
NYTFNLSTGMLTSLKRGNDEQLHSPCRLICHRAPTDNDMYIRRDWEAEFLNKAYFSPRTYIHALTASGNLEYRVEGTFGADARRPLYRVEILYTVNGDGMKTEIKAKAASPKDGHPLYGYMIGKPLHLPRFALEIPLNKSYEKLKYHGRGPYECYTDFSAQSHIGLFESIVREQYEPHIRPQECGNHTECAFLEIAGDNAAIRVEAVGGAFEFSALHYSVEQLAEAKHRHELKEFDGTYLLINYKVGGIGSNSCGPALPEKYQFKEAEFSYAFTVKVY